MHYPNHLLLLIFKHLNVADRMRLVLVAKRVRDLVYSTSLWLNCDSLALQISLMQGNIICQVEGKNFEAAAAARALELLFMICPPITKCSIHIDSNVADDGAVHSLITSISKNMPGSNKTVRQLLYSGRVRYFAYVADCLLNHEAQDTVISLEIQDDPDMTLNRKAILKDVWRVISGCENLVSFSMVSCSGFSHPFDSAGLNALRGKNNLKEFALKGFRTGALVEGMVDLVESSPSLQILRHGDRSNSPKYLLDLSEAALGRLTVLNLYVSPESTPRHILMRIAEKLPNLRESTLRIAPHCASTAVITIAHSFMTMWCGVEEFKSILIKFKAWPDSSILKNPLIIRRLCKEADEILMLYNGYFGMKKGKFVLKLKFQP